MTTKPDPDALADELRQFQQDANLPYPPTPLTLRYRKAVAGEGADEFLSLGYQWADKPHRLVWDLCRVIEEQAALRAEYDDQAYVEGVRDLADMIERDKTANWLAVAGVLRDCAADIERLSRAHSPEASRVGEAICQQCDPPGCGKECRGGDCATCGGTGRVRSEPVSPAREEVERHVAAILEEWDMKEPPNAFTGHSYEDIARDIVGRACLSALQPQQQEKDWQPIETAPRDGTIVLAYGDALPTYFYAIVWEDGEWRYCSQDKGWASAPTMPTHWMPLPDAPTSSPLPSESPQP